MVKIYPSPPISLQSALTPPTSILGSLLITINLLGDDMICQLITGEMRCVTIPFPFALWLLCAQLRWHLFPFRSYAHGHYALTGCCLCHVIPAVPESCDTGSLTRMFPISVSRDFYCTCMCHGDSPRPTFVMLMISHLCFLLISGYVDSSFSRPLCPVCYLTTRLLFSLPTGRYSCILTLTVLTPVCTCISQTCIYTGLEMGRSPSSIYFATTLKLWPERSHVLSLDRSSSLAKATALLVCSRCLLVLSV